MSGRSFVLDLDRCTGCGACVLGCQTANRLAPGTSWRRVETFNRQRFSNAPVVHLSLGCFHCQEPACANGCPAHALSRDPATGTVQADADRCLGCRYCTWLCPHGAPRFDPVHGTVAKCTLCIDRIVDGRDPACVVACPTGALAMELGQPSPEQAADWPPGLPGRELGPAVVARRHRRREPPRAVPSPAPFRPPKRVPQRRWQGAIDEWSLLAFSLLVAVSVGWSLGAVFGGAKLDATWLAVLGLAAGAVAAAHLGRPARAWRAASNLRRSWVSREVVLFGVFLVSGISTDLLSLGVAALVFVVASGLATVAAVDMVYRVRHQEHPVVPHSAMATLTAVFIAVVLAGEVWAVVPIVGAKAGLYIWRAARFRDLGWRVVLRLMLLGAGPTLVLTGSPVVGWLALGVGELIDRAELYAELRFLDPTLQAQRDLERLTNQSS